MNIRKDIYYVSASNQIGENYSDNSRERGRKKIRWGTLHKKEVNILILNKDII